MLIQTIFGSIAFVTTIIGLFPQIYKSIQTRSTHDLSMPMLMNFLICSLAWIIYGTYTSSFFVQFSNILSLISCLLLIVLKKYYDKIACCPSVLELK